MASHSAQPIRLKCKFRTGQCVLDNLTTESTVSDLLSSICSTMKMDRSEVLLFHGYPPKPLLLSNHNLFQRLSEVPLVSGDTLTVDVSKSAPYMPPNQAAVSRTIPVQKAPQVDGTLRTQEPHLLRLSAPSDNSCLFTSVLFCMDNADEHQPIGTKVVTNKAAVAQMRELIASIVQSDPQNYSEAFLGMPNAVYCHQIQEPDRWGGGIEVAVLSQVLDIEICVVDIQSCRIDRFGEDRGLVHRILLMYDGIHYDPMAMARPDINRLITIFSTKNNQVLLEAQDLATQARDEWRFTDLASFTLICRQCQMPLTGQSGAEQHARQTGHTEFSEIPNT